MKKFTLYYAGLMPFVLLLIVTFYGFNPDFMSYCIIFYLCSVFGNYIMYLLIVPEGDRHVISEKQRNKIKNKYANKGKKREKKIKFQPELQVLNKSVEPNELSEKDKKRIMKEDLKRYKKNKYTV